MQYSIDDMQDTWDKGLADVHTAQGCFIEAIEELEKAIVPLDREASYLRIRNPELLSAIGTEKRLSVAIKKLQDMRETGSMS